MKVYIIRLVPAQTSYLGKFWLMIYEPKCFKTNQLYLKKNLACRYRFKKRKRWLVDF